MKDSLLAVVLLVCLVGLCQAIGRVCLRRVPDVRGYELLAFGVPLGMGIVGYMVLVVGLLGGLHSPIFFGLMIAGAAALLVFRAANTTRYDLPTPRSPLFFPACIVFALLGVGTIVAALAPPVGLEWDSLSYHLADPQQWIRAGRITYLPWEHHSNFPFTIQMLYLTMLAVGSMAGAKLVHWTCAALLALSIYTFCVRHLSDGSPVRSKTVGLVASTLFAATPIVLWEATTAYIDLATALFTWLALYALIEGVGIGERAETKGNTPTSLPWLLLSSVLMGFALGTKYTVLGFWGLCLVGLVVARVVQTRRVDAALVRDALLWAGVSLAIAASWYVKNIVWTGNPVYPFAYSLFHGRYWSTENAAQYAQAQAAFGLGKSPLDLLLSPWQVTQEPLYISNQRPFIFTEYITSGFGLSPAVLGILGCVPFLARGKKMPPVLSVCLWFALGVYVFWFFMMQQTRYLIPGLPALCVVCAHTLVSLWETRGGILRVGAAAFAGLSVAWGIVIALGVSFFGVPGLGGGRTAPVYPVVFGQMDEGEYVARRLPGIGLASQWINLNTPKDAKVALFDEVRGFYIDREYIWAQPDHAANYIPWDEYKGVDDWLSDFKRRGITVIVQGNNVTPDDKRWRYLLKEAIETGKVTPVFHTPGSRPVFVHLIP